ncbi:Ger(x)C family spore germination protein [Paenibacillus sp. HWE-109]|uniref:Ger(x)C family spore germination protein n=1 Tax=Paenibacillus sp. HWE-109 TaxID=1306526 RepID=UPI001EE033C8|nr:Ger(x)C family spore germination protein [Paenibacillus sp. HWE-109]UKS24331.1 Ger(x)C family spore germination protein [Paenibacillus sp. HWE-109]
MNKLLLPILLLAATTGLLTGCADRLDMENASIPLTLGLDLGQDNEPVMYSTFPVFTKNSKKKTQETSARARTFRQSRAEQDAHSAGVFSGRNYQVFLIGKRMLEQENWFQMLDVIFRDSKNTVSDRVIVFDGPLADIIYLNPKDQPLLPILLRGMVDTKSGKSETVNTNLQELHRQLFESGMTPSISEVRLDAKKNIKLNGTALLNHQGKYVTSLDTSETVLLRILQNKVKKSASITLSMPGEPEQKPFHLDKISFATDQTRTETKTITSTHQGEFHFDIIIKMKISLFEVLFPYDIENKTPELEQLLSEEMQKQFEKLIKKIQQHAIDPVGLGLHARAFEYKEYKAVKNDWGKALSSADIRVQVKIKIDAMGPVK